MSFFYLHIRYLMWLRLSVSSYFQLLNAMKEEKILVDFEEGTINFDPTYKYDYGTSTYDTR